MWHWHRLRISYLYGGVYYKIGCVPINEINDIDIDIDMKPGADYAFICPGWISRNISFAALSGFFAFVIGLPTTI